MSDSSEVIFVSHAGPDGQWAEWVAWHLQEAGYEVELGLWHWRTGDDFVKKMNDALARCSAVVALFSPAYFAPGRYTEEEWTAPVARRDRLIPVVVEPLEKEGRLGRHDEAFRTLTDVLERRRRVLGNDHPDTLSTANVLAGALNHLGRPSEAERLQKSTRHRIRETLGADHPLYRILTDDLVVTLKAQGKTYEAQKLTRKGRRR